VQLVRQFGTKPSKRASTKWQRKPMVADVHETNDVGSQQFVVEFKHAHAYSVKLRK
jgi:hypothetical protein